MVDFLTPEVKKVARILMEELDCPRSLGVKMLIDAGEWLQLVKLECNPLHYADARDFMLAYQATELLRKLDSALPGLDLERAAIEKWWWAERECFRTNRRLNEIQDFGSLNGEPVPDEMLGYISEARRFLFETFGSSPRHDFDGRFGPGATMSDVGGRTSVLDKMTTVPTLTPAALFFLFPWTETKWGAASAARGDEPKIVRGNSFFTVPKSATSRRACAKEPSVNGFYQLGLGRSMRRALLTRGIDLSNGQDVHRQVACAASFSGEFCTIDLSSASDTLSTSLVRMLMPHAWHSVLDDLRSPFTKVEGKWVRLEKFSSMGNGFTFELETAIFAALIQAVSNTIVFGKNAWVYGDDIIVPTQYAKATISALKFFGFTPNERKTFLEGSFRESCGGDFFNGTAVRPYYITELPNEPHQFISLANGLRRAPACESLRAATGRPLKSWFTALDYIPSAVRSCRGPQGFGDVVIHDEPERWSTRWRGDKLYTRVYRPVSGGVRFTRFTPDVQFAAALYGVTLQPGYGWKPGCDNRILPTRDRVRGYKVGWCLLYGLPTVPIWSKYDRFTPRKGG